jgi:aspartyl-tRNA(Asn)/glutamyl-tRNA(Gln) amidotransferase subunit A
VTDEDIRQLIDAPALRPSVPATTLTEALLERVERLQPQVGALITVTPELALDGARRADEARARGEPLPLDGLPVVLKDNIDVAGVATTVGSRLFAGRIAQADAAVTERLRAAGAVLLGKANMHELAFGATSRNEAFGHVVNPAAPDRISGGSSGGSAAAVAADLCVAAIGTDTGGSIRLPASLCGVTGLRPTYGAVSTRGVQPVSHSLDTIGPLARATSDVRAVFEAISDTPPARDSGRERVWRVGVAEALVEASDDVVAACVRGVADVLAELGATVVPVEIPNVDVAVEACGHLIKAEALALYGDALAATPELFEEGTRSRLALAASLTDADLVALRKELDRYGQTMGAVFAEIDVLMLPTIPVEAPLAEGADAVDTTAAVVPYTHLLSLARVPSISIPCGVTPSGAPVGAQVAAPPWRDDLVVSVGEAIQSVTDWHCRRVALSAPAGRASP